TLTVANSPGWATNQWAGFVMHRTALASGAANHKMSLITGNSGAALTLVYYTSSGSGVTWSAGDKFEIHRPLITIDQPGRGECKDKVTTDAKSTYSINQTTGKQTWPHQLLEPWVCWNDRHINGSTVTYLSLYMTGGTEYLAKPGRDYINGTASMPSAPNLVGYKPYVYPHPLVSGVNTTTLAPPTN